MCCYAAYILGIPNLFIAKVVCGFFVVTDGSRRGV